MGRFAVTYCSCRVDKPDRLDARPTGTIQIGLPNANIVLSSVVVDIHVACERERSPFAVLDAAVVVLLCTFCHEGGNISERVEVVPPRILIQ
jgi:hypothetical protein